MKYILSVDIGGTSVKLGLFNEQGLLLKKWEINTRKEGNGKYIIPDIVSSIGEKLQERGIDRSQVMGVGVDVPGPVIRDSTVTECVNIGWGTVNVSKELGDLLSLEVIVGNGDHSG